MLLSRVESQARSQIFLDLKNDWCSCTYLEQDGATAEELEPLHGVRVHGDYGARRHDRENNVGSSFV
jgi:hypothetical protein